MRTTQTRVRYSNKNKTFMNVFLSFFSKFEVLKFEENDQYECKFNDINP